MAIIHHNRLEGELLQYFCTNQWGFNVVVVEQTGTDGVAAVSRTQPEVVFASLSMIDLGAVELIRQLRSAAPSAKIVGLTSQYSEYWLHTLRATEYHGLLLDVDEGLCSLAQAIERVRHGIRHTSSRIVQCQTVLRTAPAAFPKLLSLREQEVLVCIAHSMSDAEIGFQLGFSADTAHWHRKKILGKLNIHNTPRLIKYCLEKGFNTVPPPSAGKSGGVPK